MYFTSTQVYVGSASIAISLLYAAFQAHLLPPTLAKIVAKLFFYPTIPFTFLARGSNYYTLIDSHVFLGAVPMFHVKEIFDRGVRAVVNLCDEYPGPIREYQKYHIAQLYLPTVVSQTCLYIYIYILHYPCVLFYVGSSRTITRGYQTRDGVY